MRATFLNREVIFLDIQYKGFEFIERLEKLWNEKESTKPHNERKKFTQTELAEYIGVNNTQISKWQNAKDYPTTKTLIKISKAFNCSIDYLLGLEESYSTRKEIDLLDILRELFIYDCKDKKIFKTLQFDTDEQSLPDLTYNFLFEINISTNGHHLLSDLIDEYNKRKGAFDYLELDEVIMIIDKMINKYRLYIDFGGSPFKKK